MTSKERTAASQIGLQKHLQRIQDVETAKRQAAKDAKTARRMIKRLAGTREK